MGLEEVKREIIEKAEKEARGIIEEGRKESNAIIEEINQKISEYRKEAENEAEKIIETMERREIAGVEFDVKKMMLDKKKEVIDSVFSYVKKKLIEMPEKQRERYIRSLVEKAKSEIKVKCIYGNKQDKKIIEKIPAVKYKEADICGGIIAENEDGTIRIDYSYDEILEQIQKENLRQIAEMLFK
ncbi:MAG: V-type ATP synthase subunit E family protein [Candidatus Woesearchaeota archaeon]|nr:V-type ATP synthase subunit E family protein [Candidatus Woesearchaeota archaeon]